MSVMNTLASYLEGGVAHGPLMLGYVMTFVTRRNSTYQVARALRFRSSNSAFMSLTPAAGTQDKYKIRVGIKRASLGSKYVIIGAGAATPDLIYFDSSDRLCWDFAGTTRLVSTSVYRDPSAWGTWEFIYDAGNATASLKARVFYNGVEITTWTTDTRSSITTGTSKINTNVAHNIGRDPVAATSHFSGYMSDFALIDNSATSGFSGATTTATGAWDPEAPTGAKWWLKMSNNASTAALGNDSGSDSAAWTTSGFSVTAGTTNDSLTDTPTNYGTDTGAGGEVRGNYCTSSPLDKTSAHALANGNLQVTTSASGSWSGGARSTWFASSGKWYWEATIGTIGSCGLGVANTSSAMTAHPGSTVNEFAYHNDGTLYNNGAGAANSSYTTNDVIGFAMDLDSGTPTLKYYKNGVLQTNSHTLVSGTLYSPYGGAVNSSGTWHWNFGQRPFANTAPSGYKALCTQNLPDPDTGKRSDSYMTIASRTGTGSAGSVSGQRLQPDIVWSKGGSGNNAAIADSQSGTGKYVQLSGSTAAQVSDAQAVTAFNADGFSFGTAALINTNGTAYKDKLFKKSATAGIDIVTYTGDGTTNRNISHSLGAAPEFALIKRLDSTSSWFCWHTAFGNAASWIPFEGIATATTTNSPFGTGNWSSTQFMVSANATNNANVNSGTYVAYLFRGVSGFSAFKSYTGNASTDGPFIHLGFRPKVIMIRGYDTTTKDGWLLDSVRDTVNPVANYELLDGSSESTQTLGDFLSNGLKIRVTTSGYNNSGHAFALIAFAEFPFRYARAR